MTIAAEYQRPELHELVGIGIVFLTIKYVLEPKFRLCAAINFRLCRVAIGIVALDEIGDDTAIRNVFPL